MDFAFSAEQEALRTYATQWIDARATPSVVRTIADSETGHDADLWKQMADMGWLGMAISEEQGGAGFGFLEQAVLLEEFGACLLPSPFLSTAVLGATALALAGTDHQRAEWLPRIVSGDAIVTVAGMGWGEGHTDGPSFDGDILSGEARHVLDASIADLIVVAESSADGARLVAVPADAVHVVPMATMDRTRRTATVRFDDVVCRSEWRMNRSDDGRAVMDALRRRAAVAMALEQTGGARRCLEMSVDYAKSRTQFGRPIGSFQAVKHMCADMFVAVQASQAAAYYAAWAEASEAPDADEAASLAKAHCSEAFFSCAADTIQVHGGIGFTWEHDAHLYFKRAETSRLSFGAPTTHRRLLADRLGLR